MAGIVTDNRRVVFIMANSPQIKTPSNSRGLDPKWSNSTTLCRGSNSTPSEKEKGESVCRNGID